MNIHKVAADNNIDLYTASHEDMVSCFAQSDEWDEKYLEEAFTEGNIEGFNTQKAVDEGSARFETSNFILTKLILGSFFIEKKTKFRIISCLFIGEFNLRVGHAIMKNLAGSADAVAN